MNNRDKNGILASEQGNTFIIIALMSVALMTLTAAVVDLGRLYTVRAKAQSALDAAVLGVVATINTSDPVTELPALFRANFPAEYLGATPWEGNPAMISLDDGSYIAYLAVRVPYLTLGLITDPYKDLLLGAKVEKGITENIKEEFELALVLDNSRSMIDKIEGDAQTKMDALKVAAQDLVNILYGPKDTLKNLHISVVPFNMAVNIGVGRSEWMQESTGNSKFPTTPEGSLGEYKLGQKNECRQSFQDIPPFYHYFSSRYNYQCQEKGLVGGREAKSISDPISAETYSPYTTNDKSLRIPRGYAMNRQSDYFCGKYVWPGLKPGCQTTDCKDITTCTQETPIVCTTVRVCPGCENATWQCTNNGANDISDDSPDGNNDLLKFRVPHEQMFYKWSGFGNDDIAWATYLSPMLFASNAKGTFTQYDEARLARPTKAMYTDTQNGALNALSAMYPNGSTRINVGLMWGWFTLSPKWVGVWDKDGPKKDLPGDLASNAYLRKQMVLMTDGKNVLDPANSSAFAQFPDGDDDKTRQLCQAIKDSGVTIYSIGFGKEGDYKKELICECASEPGFCFTAATGDDLRKVFKQIGDNIVQTTLRLTF